MGWLANPEGGRPPHPSHEGGAGRRHPLGEYDLLQLHLPVRALKDPGAAGHRQVRVLVGQVRSLHRYVTVVPEVEGVDRLVPVTFLLRFVFDQNAQTTFFSPRFYFPRTKKLKYIYLENGFDRSLLYFLLLELN
jgi:hypothetical protein